MKNYLRMTNLSMGVAVVIFFAFSGWLMRNYYHNAESQDVERLFRRSRHIYILLAGLMQGGIGVYIYPYSHYFSHKIQWAATGIMAVGSLSLIVAFFIEIPNEIISIPVSRFGLYLLLASAIFHLISNTINKSVQSKTK